MSKIVYLFESMECEYDSYKYVEGIFSDKQKVIDYIKSNYYLIEDVYSRKLPVGKVFEQFGYNVKPDSVQEDDLGLYSTYIDEEDGETHKHYLYTQTLFSVTAIELDELLLGDENEI